MTKSTSELERDAERTRADLSATLDEIRTRMEPGRLFDQAFSYARNNGGADFVRNAATQARDNPLPVLLIGAGLAWLMSGRQPGAGPSTGSLSAAGTRATHNAQDAVAGAASTVGSAVSAAASNLKGALQSGQSGLENAGSRVGSMASDARHGLQASGSQIGDTVGQLQRLCLENPVAVGAIGLAIGAAIGAALPSTETENRLLGHEADDVKSALKDKAAEGLERGEQIVRAGLEAASGETESTTPSGVSATHSPGGERPPSQVDAQPGDPADTSPSTGRASTPVKADPSG